MPVRYRIFLVVVSASLLLDQVTKAWFRDHWSIRERRTVIPGFFDLVRAENPGAAWGMFRDSAYRIPFFVAVALVAFVVIIGYLRKLPDDQRVLATSFSLIFAGAAGNLVDRVRFQRVTDFLDFYVGAEPVRSWLIDTVGSNHWPVFNVADIAISVGVGLFALFVLIIEPRQARAAAEASPPDGRGATTSA
ncbi:signal peptidase II [Myxococcota bacterium]|nr:signal peptidase II [Myxococcota bacterium]